MPYLRLALVLLMAQLPSAEYVAAPGPGDGGAGTVESPFRSLAKATQRLAPGDTLWIRGGVWRETLTVPRSGTKNSPITIRGWQGEMPVITGADPVEGWRATKLGYVSAWQAPMGWSLGDGEDQIFVDGAMMVEARWPNLKPEVEPWRAWREDWALATGGAWLEVGATGGTARSRLDHSGLAKLSSEQVRAAHVNALMGALWATITGEVAGVSATSLTFTHPGMPESWAEPRLGSRFFLWGGRGLLDAPREWWRDPAGQLLLIPPDGKDPSGHLVEAKRRKDAIDLRDRAWITIGDLAIRAGTIVTSAASEGVVIQGVDAGFTTHGTRLTGWWHVFASSIELRGPSSAILDSTVWAAAGSGITLAGQGQTVRNCVVHDTGYIGLKGPSVHLWKATGSVIEGNTLWDSGSHNIVELTEARDARIVGNDISGSARLCIDEGAIQIKRDWDAGATVIERNWIHDTWGLTGADGKEYYGNVGIYSEPNSKGYRITGNLMWNTVGSCLAFTGPSAALVSGNTADSTPYGPVGAADHKVVDFKRAKASGPAQRFAEPVLPFQAGATLASVHLPQLSVAQQGSASGSTFTLGDLPAGRVPGPTFGLKAGSEARSGVTTWRDGRWVVSRVTWPKQSGQVRVLMQVGDGPAVALPRKVEADPVRESAPAKIYTAVTGAVAAWDDRLLSRLRTAIASRRGPLCRIHLGRAPAEVEITGLSEDRTLRLAMRGSMGGTTIDWPWRKLSPGERLSIAQGLRRGLDEEASALIAFYGRLAGDEAAVREHLPLSGRQSDAVNAAFAVETSTN
ncbi:MAG TPA: hypothetical protein DCS97_07485 [Planctomycetes bacterium]|nr:hypothetical protein [Planctomycetota bacterium]